MNYITTVQAGDKWGISSRRVLELAKSERIPGVIKIGSRWMIPADAKKPEDGRTGVVKTQKKEKKLFFRYPVFEGHDITDFSPVLSAEEVQIKNAGEAFYACRFQDALRALGDMSESSSNIYHRIYALYACSMINFVENKITEFFICYEKLSEELKKDFPRKKEMSDLIYQISANLGMNGYFINEFEVDQSYSYHESYLPHLAAQCIISLYCSDVSKLSPGDLRAYEFICSSYDDKEYYLDSQTMHLYLGVVYASMLQTQKMKYHYKKGLELAQKYELYWSAAVIYYYYGKSMESALAEFDDEFICHLRSLSEDIHERYLRFMESLSRNNIFSLLNKKDYIYVFCAIQGCSNKQVASLLNVSQTTVGNKYSVIYETLGVSNKKELVEYCKRSTGGLVFM